MTAKRDIYDGRMLLGVVCERSDDSFVAVVNEQVFGPYNTSRHGRRHDNRTTAAMVIAAAPAIIGGNHGIG
jgi:hypothetical protein